MMVRRWRPAAECLAVARIGGGLAVDGSGQVGTATA